MNRVVLGAANLHDLDHYLVFAARSQGRLRLRIGEVLEKLFSTGGHRELGFNSIAAYSLERLSQSGRWASESRTVARRVADLPCIRRAFDGGHIGWCKLEMLCRAATPENERALLEQARRLSVRALRKQLTEPRAEESNQEQHEMVSLVRRVPAEHAWSLEATLDLVDHVSGGCAPAERVEWLLAEGYTSLICEAPPEIADITEGLTRRADEVRERMRAQAEECDEREAEFECDLPLSEAIEGEAPFDWDEPLPDDPNALDALVREYAGTLAARDICLGKALSRFFSGRQYERLGYVSASQYARERLGMSKSSVYERIALARATRRFDRLVEALCDGKIGFHAARLISRVASPETEAAWVERASRTTYKYLREDVQLVELEMRLKGDDANRMPPDEKRLEEYRSWRREVLTGQMFRAGEAEGERQGEPQGKGSGDDAGVRMSARSPFPNASRGFIDIELRVPKDIAIFWSELEEAFHKSGIDDLFVPWLCQSYIETWLPHLGNGGKWEPIAARDLYECTCPVCLSKEQTDHHIVFRSHGGGDEPENNTSPCWADHGEGIHGGRLRVFGKAPGELTWLIGRKPIMIVRGRERELLG